MARTATQEFQIENARRQQGEAPIAPNIPGSDSSRIRLDRMRRILHEQGGEAVLKDNELGRGIDNTAITTLLDKLPSGAARAAARDLIISHNQFVESGFDSFDDATQNQLRNNMRTYIENGNAGVAFRAAIPTRQTEIINSMLQDEDYEIALNKRLHAIVGRDIRPSAGEINGQADEFRDNLPGLDITIRNRIARATIIQERILAERGDIITALGRPPTPEEIAQAERKARDNVAGGARGGLNVSNADRDARVLTFTAGDPTINQTALETVARQALVGRNQQALIDDLADLPRRAVVDVNREYRRAAAAAEREDIGDDLVRKKMQEIKTTISTFDPNAYGPNGKARTMFDQMRNRGIESFFIEFGPDGRTVRRRDDEALEALRNNPELRTEFSSQVIEDLTLARMKVENPPMSQTDFAALSSLLEGSPEDRIRAIMQMLNSHQMFRDVRGAAMNGGIVDQDTLPKLLAAVKDKNMKVAGGAITALLTALLTGALTMNPLAAAALVGGGFYGIYKLGQSKFDNYAKNQRYEEPDLGR